MTLCGAHRAIWPRIGRLRPCYTSAMATGSLTLSEHPRELVQVVCDRCERKGRYRGARLIAKHGPDIRLPDLLREIAANCPKAGGLGNDMCGARYEGL